MWIGFLIGNMCFVGLNIWFIQTGQASLLTYIAVCANASGAIFSGIMIGKEKS